MRSVSNRLLVATAFLLLLAGLLWFGGNLYLSEKAQRVEVVAAVVEIPRGSIITDGMLGRAEVPRGSEARFLQRPEEALGRVARVDILPGTLLTSLMLASEPPPPGRVLPAGTVLSPDYFAIAVPLEPVDAAGGALRVGDRVSIYASTLLTPTEGIPTPLARHVRILDLYTREGTSLLSAPAGRAAEVALLEADFTLANLLMEASRQGRLRLVLEGGER
ncbi:MAG: RcpC/CpaB family pilus assembly protein [Chloroflexia bacterium]